MKKTSAIRAKVALRVRPLSLKEHSDRYQSVVKYTEQQQQIILGDEKIYDFDYVFNHDSTQNEVYENCASELVDKVFAGYDVTIFAYGQTGSGKTYTMGTNYKKNSSSEESCGIIPRLLVDIFNARDNSSASKIHIAFTFVEIYNEVLYDLMTSKSQQQKGLRDAQSAVKLKGMKKINLNSCEEALQLFEEGCARRVQEKTCGNLYSSRSHAIFTLDITKYNKKGDAITSKLNLVDLAGSEASSRNLNSNNRYKEGININLSLLTLGKVIRALRDTSNIAQPAHIPYRDSLLTRLLKDSLSSNCFILMIACINPAGYCLAETMVTLSYATTVCCIKTRPIVKTSTAKKAFRNPLHILPPTPAWVKQGLNLTIATPSIRPTPAKESRPYRMTVGSIQREVQDSGCSPIFKEPFQPRPFHTPYQAAPMRQISNSIVPIKELQFSPPSKTVQKTLKDYFTPSVSCLDKENLPVKETPRLGPVEKGVSDVTPSTVSFLSPVPLQNFSCLTPLRDRTNVNDSPALNTRSCGRKRSFAASEEVTDTSHLLTLKKYSPLKPMSLMFPVVEEQSFVGSPALNTNSAKRSIHVSSDQRDSPASNTRSRGKSPFLPSTGDIYTSSATIINEKEDEVPSFTLTEKVVSPISLVDLDDEIFELPPPSVKKYHLRDRLTIHCYRFPDELWKTERKRKPRKTEVFHKDQTTRQKTRGRKRVTENGPSKAKQAGGEFLQQHSHENDILNLLNTGSLKDLQKLPSIGPKTAYIIFTWRKLKGPFQDIRDLKQVIGLQPTFFAKFAKTNLIYL